MRDSVQKVRRPALGGGSAAAAVGAVPSPQSEAFSALVALGYKPPKSRAC